MRAGRGGRPRVPVSQCRFACVRCACERERTSPAFTCVHVRRASLRAHVCVHESVRGCVREAVCVALASEEGQQVPLHSLRRRVRALLAGADDLVNLVDKHDPVRLHLHARTHTHTHAPSHRQHMHTRTHARTVIHMHNTSTMAPTAHTAQQQEAHSKAARTDMCKHRHQHLRGKFTK